MPAGMEIEQMTSDRLLIHRAVGRSVETLGGLRTPPHCAFFRVRTAKPVTEESALSEGGLDALADAGILDQRPRHKAAESDQSGVERPRPVGYDMLANDRMHTVSANQKIALGAAAVGGCQRQCHPLAGK